MPLSTLLSFKLAVPNPATNCKLASNPMQTDDVIANFVQIRWLIEGPVCMS